MKIALINSAGNGSTGKICRDIMSGDETNEYRFFYGYLPTIQDERCHRIATTFGIKTHQVMTRFLGYHGLASKKDTRHLVKLLEEYDPDIIHLHNIHGFYLNYRILFDYIKKNNKKVVWTLHDCWSFTGHCAYYDMASCDKWKNGCNHCPNLRAYPISLFFDRSKKQFALKKESFLGVQDMILVSPSKWLQGEVKKSFLKDYSIKVINNGIDLTNFKPVDNHSFDKVIDRSKKTVLAVANVWGKRKGYGDLIKLSSQLSDEFELVMVGVSDAQIEELKNTKIIPIKRTENQQQLAELYSLATCFVNTTYEDNYPTVNIEALACGCPVITYATGGSVEVVEEGNGLVVEQGNIDALLDAINNIDKVSIDRDKISSRTRELHGKETMTNEYNELYRSMR